MIIENKNSYSKFPPFQRKKGIDFLTGTPYITEIETLSVI